MLKNFASLDLDLGSLSLSVIEDKPLKLTASTHVGLILLASSLFDKKSFSHMHGPIHM